MLLKKQRSCLVSVHGTGNILAALAAVRHFGDRYAGGRPARVVTLVHPPTDSRAAANEIGDMVARLTAGQGWPAPLVLTTDDLATIGPAEGEPYWRSLERFRDAIGGGEFNEVYYAHDFVNRVPELMMNAYPRASHVTFGDSLGFVFNAHYVVSQVMGASREEAAAAARGAAVQPPRPSRWRDNKTQTEPRPFQARYAVLILPMDHTGDYLNDKTLLVVPKNVIAEVISACEKSLPELRAFSADVLETTPSPHYLMLLENDVEANSMSFETAVTMYEQAVRRNAPKGSSILIKPHPLAVEPVAECVAERLAPDHAVSIIPADLVRCPLEVWKTLLEACEVISPLSSCYISLSYLYDKKVILTAGRDWIREFFPQQAWEYMDEVDTRYRDMVASIGSWDHNSVLWRGTMEPDDASP